MELARAKRAKRAAPMSHANLLLLPASRISWGDGAVWACQRQKAACSRSARVHVAQ